MRRSENKKQTAHFDRAMKLIDDGRFKIQPKKGGFVVYKPNREQRRLYALVRRLIADGQPVRIIILKARQLGFSTAIAILFFALCITRDGVETLVTAHSKNSADKIFGIYRRCLRLMPEDERPATRFDSKREMQFSDTQSRIAVEVAKDGDFGRSGTTTYAHFSELAWWKEQRETFNSAMSQVPREQGTIAIIETTAKGWGDTFHSTWERAEKAMANEIDGDGNPITSVWHPFFVGWHSDPTYKQKTPKNFEMTPEESILAAEYELIPSQINWRRRVIADECDGQTELFDREYPISPTHAFRATGISVFSPESIEHQIKHFVTPPKVRLDVGCTVRGDPYKYGNPRGCFHLYQPPAKGREYVIGADPAHSPDLQACQSVAQILDAESLELAGSWKGRIPASDFADTLAGLGMMYNNAYIACEINAMGVATLDRLYKQLHYHNLHWHKVVGMVNAPVQWKYGFHSNSRSRPLAIMLLRRMLSEKMLAVYDKDTVTELQSFGVSDNGKMQAPKGSNDDHVMALAIAVYAGNEMYQWMDKKTFPEKRVRKTHIFDEVEPKDRIKQLMRRRGLTPLYRSMYGLTPK